MRVRHGMVATLGLLVLGPLGAGCGTSSASTGKFDPQQNVQPPVASGAPEALAPSPSPTASTPPPASDPIASTPIGKPGSWRVTTYYTAVESLHGGAMTPVKGCPSLHCSNGHAPLGAYPSDFLRIIRTEGSGRITSGPQKGRFLNWSHSTGYWLDDSTRDPAGRPLKAWESAAADRDVLARGQRFVITDCGTGVPAAVCARFRQARWTVTDLFRPGYGGKRHADVYLGEETGPDFSRYSTTLNGASLGAI
ncbi:hypothetical protein [Actinomadura rupiterrae]|uniref:hypothetical protein n=1 Tax=Actinomadura rupiterrae TaxID=559627 RepID=UPI0020A4ABC1|nr:hypothetical protein [Actinomadura rupiterrae]MCP2339048.1 hypothetical protein [Actinomadura rupiterrae]